MLEIIKYLVPGGSGLFALLLLLLLWPEKIEKWSALLWKLLDKLRILCGVAHKRYVKHDIQGRVNDFTKRLAQEIPTFRSLGINIEWITGSTSRQSFIDDGKVVVRLKREDDNNYNFVQASMLFISQSLLLKAKRYISKSQKEAADLFTGMKLFQSEKDEVVDVFISEWLFPKIGGSDTKVANYFSRYEVIDRAGLFFPVYIQELNFLGEKVFGKRRDQRIMHEVDELIRFLEGYAERVVGQDMEPYLEKAHCRCAIMIIGKAFKVKVQKAVEPYVNHIKGTLIPAAVETVYIMGPVENQGFIQEVCEQCDHHFEVIYKKNYRGILQYRNGESRKCKNHLAVLRARQHEHYYPANDIPA